jgi:glycosyltransferase involved in cell wall biosynthesis
MWICCQRGAREHYAIPRALRHLGELRLLLTDCWLNRTMPFSTRFPQRIAGRFHPDLSDATVKSFCLQTLFAEAKQKFLRRHWYRHQQYLNRLFQEACIREMRQMINEDSVRTVFAYSYAAKEIFAYAKSRGWKTVLGQIDPGPLETEIVLSEYAKLGLSAGTCYQSPPEYWSDWRNECSLADYIVVNSDWSRNCLLKQGIPDEKLKIIPCAFVSNHAIEIGGKAYPSYFSNERPMRVLFLGQTTIRKGIHILMDAAQRLIGKPVRFTVVGEGLDHPCLAIPPNVAWIGQVPRQEAAKYYRQADVFVLPTFSDGFALVQLEAMAWALPVITTNHCGQVVENGKNGIVLEDIRSATLAQALIELVDSPAKLKSMTTFASVDNIFSLSAVGGKFLKLVDGAAY